jgi:hypothetical protein
LTTRFGAAPGWIGMECGTEEAAVRLLRAIAVEDVLVRREDATLYVPVDIREDVDGAIDQTSAAVSAAHRLYVCKTSR